MATIRVALESRSNESLSIEELQRAFREVRRYRLSLMQQIRSRAARYLTHVRSRGIKQSITYQRRVHLEGELLRLKGFEDGYQEGLRAAHNDCLKLVLKVAREVIRTEVSTHPEVVLHQIEHELRARTTGERLRLFVPPELVSAAAKHFHKLYSLRILSCTTLEPNTARLETESGSVSFDYREHFERVSRLLTTKLKQKFSETLPSEGRG